MERYLSISKPRRDGNTAKSKGKDKSARFQPYPTLEHDASTKPRPKTKERIALLEQIEEPEASTSTSLTKFLLNTLSDQSNPITHSDVYERADHAVSTSTGHQVADGRAPSTRPGYLEHRKQKIAIQQNECKDTATKLQVLKDTRIYINGYLADTTDIEMKRLITGHGGQVLLTPSGATHILTSQGLNGSKTQKMLTSKRPVHVVNPEWVNDSIEIGKRRPERTYSMVKPTSTLTDMWAR